LRNQFEIDEGDFYNEILMTKTINNLKSLGFFKNVNRTIIDDINNDKIINISVEEKSTGEIGASAGVGTSGKLIRFFCKRK
jgi:outer membrane protein insertion porin family